MKRTAILCVLTFALLPPSGSAQESPDKPEGLKERTEGLDRQDGFFPFFVDTARGTILAELSSDPPPFLYATGLASGLGSNPVGLDRGQWGKTRLCRWKRVGSRMFLIEQNTGYRATSQNPAEKKAVKDSFVDSIFWATDIIAESDQKILIDLQGLLIRDAHAVVNTLKRSDQGDYKFDSDLSFIELDQCQAFPKNSELNAVVTYATSRGGSLVSQAAADGNSFSLRLHHSFIQLPPPGYQPRKSDPRVASFGVTYSDYSAPLDQALEKRLIARYRLKKRNPGAAPSPPVEPIVYYLDPGTPEPVRSALLEGARWWNEAFEAAGYLDAFVVKMLPEDVDPMDIRFNIIQWVHRRTRGWSYGQTITDPRTGEIIKGHVLLGSLRVRQDRLLIDGLTSTSSNSADAMANACGIAGLGAGVDRALAVFDDALSPVDVSLARLKQLAAHEVGHTLGFSHNFAASTYGDRASVMDYPAPRVEISQDGSLDLSDAYAVGMGDWDRLMVRYAYTDFGEQSEEEGLKALLQEANQKGLLFLSDADALPAGAANPLSNLWDNGSDPVQELQHLMQVRRIALEKLNEGDLLPGQNLADLETVLVPIYLYHRYQVDAVAKMIGGFDYDYAVAGAQRKPVTPVSMKEQKAALAALLETLQPDELRIPARLLEQLPPKPHSSAMDRERFDGRTAMIFDPDSAVRTAATMVLSQILQPERATRLTAYGSPDWDFDRVVQDLTSEILSRHEQDPHIGRIIEHTLVQQLIQLADDQSTSHEVRAVASRQLGGLLAKFKVLARGSESGHHLQLMQEIQRFQARPHTPAASPKQQQAPPGSPIGSDG